MKEEREESQMNDRLHLHWKSIFIDRTCILFIKPAVFSSIIQGGIGQEAGSASTFDDACCRNPGLLSDTFILITLE